jgi:hypothetical protein
MAVNNFDPDIAALRRQLIAAGIKSADVLDELENHLREDIKRRARTGEDTSQLFQRAVAQFGRAQYRHEGVMRNTEPWLFLVGSLMTLAGCFAALRSFKKARA